MPVYGQYTAFANMGSIDELNQAIITWVANDRVQTKQSVCVNSNRLMEETYNSYVFLAAYVFE